MQTKAAQSLVAHMDRAVLAIGSKEVVDEENKHLPALSPSSMLAQA